LFLLARSLPLKSPTDAEDLASFFVFVRGNAQEWQDGRNTMPASLLSSDEIADRLASLASWRVENGELVRNVTLADFRKSLEFVNGVGELAEAADHHPDIDIRYNRVRLALATHSAGGLTHKDFDLAKQIEVLVK
jgi:4a-hydroxytetrahydrobiopterin dehydratase